MTGFTGYAIGRIEFGYGCIHIRVQTQSLTKDGEPVPQQNFDEQRIEVLEQPKKAWPKPKMTSVELGDLVLDTLTGAVGIASAKNFSLDGEVSILIEQVGLREDFSPKPPLYAAADRVVTKERRKLRVSTDSVATSGGPLARSPALR